MEVMVPQCCKLQPLTTQTNKVTNGKSNLLYNVLSCDEDELDVMYEEWRNCTDEFKEVGSLHHHHHHHHYNEKDKVLHG